MKVLSDLQTLLETYFFPKLDQACQKKRNPGFHKLTEYCSAGDLCMFDRTCRYVHTFKQLKPRFFDKKTYKREQCKYRSPTCPYGSRCLFTHDEKKFVFSQDDTTVYYSEEQKVYRITLINPEDPETIAVFQIPIKYKNDIITSKICAALRVITEETDLNKTELEQEKLEEVSSSKKLEALSPVVLGHYTEQEIILRSRKVAKKTNFTLDGTDYSESDIAVSLWDNPECDIAAYYALLDSDPIEYYDCNFNDFYSLANVEAQTLLQNKRESTLELEAHTSLKNDMGLQESVITDSDASSMADQVTRDVIDSVWDDEKPTIEQNQKSKGLTPQEDESAQNYKSKSFTSPTFADDESVQNYQSKSFTSPTFADQINVKNYS